MEIHEFISSTFKPCVSLDEQQRTMDGLDAALRVQPGFRSRRCYFNEAERRWMVHLCWEDEEAIEQSSTALGESEEFSGLYDNFDVDTIVYGRYEQRSPFD